MPPNSSDILLRLLLEDKFSAEMDKAISHYEQRVKQASSVKELDAIEREWKDVSSAIREAEKAAQQEAKVVERAAMQQTKEVERASKQRINILKVEARTLSAQAADIISGLEKAKIAQLNAISGSIQSFSTRALVGGTGLIGGIFAEANRFAREANDAEKATRETRAWAAATEQLADARKQVDQVLVREALPLLQEVARLATQASSFVESHPEIVQSALNAGKILIALGAVGTVAAKGIKLVADARYLLTIPAQLQAANLQDQAATKQLAAATMRAKDLGIDVPAPSKGLGLAGLLSGIASPLGIVTLIGATGVTAIKAADGLKVLEDRLNQIGGPVATTLNVSLNTVVRSIAPLVTIIKDLKVAAARDIPLIKDRLGIAASPGAGGTAGVSAIASLSVMSATDKGIVEAWSKWKEDDRRLVEEAAENRKKIYRDAEKSIADAARQFSRQTLNINKQFDKDRANLIKDFAENSKQAEIDYARERADVVKDAGEDIRQIEEQHQENIRQMTLDHNQRVEDLTDARDALGLAQEHERFDQQRSEAERETNQEIAQRRRDVAIRLQELAIEFATERAQRQVQFEQSLAENQARREEELKEAAVAHAEELRQIREQKAAQLRELQQNLTAERLRRREVFIAEVRDLDQALLGERNLKKQYYDLMLSDAEKWLQDYRARLSAGTTGSSIPSRDIGGYIGPGLFRVGPVREFVMDPGTTRAAERVIGGQLNQRAILNAMMGGRGQITLHDNRRFDSRLSLADRRAIQEDTMQTLDRVLG